MNGALFLAAVAAVLGPGEVVLVELATPSVRARVPLSEPGAAVFAAPDGAVIVPLTHTDATAVVRVDGRVKVEQGRLFPLFFDEFDRMFVVMPEQLALLAYPQRVTIREIPLPGVSAIRHAAVTSDGLAVALVGAAPESPGAWVVVAGGEGRLVPVAVPCLAERVVLAPNGEWLAVGCAGGRLALAGIGGAGTEVMAAGGEIGAMAVDESGRELLLAVTQADGRGALVRLRIRPGASPPAKERWRQALPRPPRALAISGATVLVLDERGLAVWDRGGRRLAGEVAIPGAIGLALLREAVGAMPESWGEPGPR
ncbi:MAG: hypothetical protein HRF46_02790 [Acidobacteriota bacterium]